MTSAGKSLGGQSHISEAYSIRQLSPILIHYKRSIRTNDVQERNLLVRTMSELDVQLLQSRTCAKPTIDVDQQFHASLTFCVHYARE